MRKVKSESWLGRMWLVKRNGGGEPERVATVGVLAFEVARLMSKVVQLWHALRDDCFARMRDEALCLEGVRKLVADDDRHLLALARGEMEDALCALARAVAGLSRRCSDPALQRFDAAFADLVRTGADPHGFEFTGRKMERKVKKMEQFIAAGADLHHELEVLAELEQGLRRMLANPDSGGQRQGSGGAVDFKQKVLWQRQRVKYLREASLWVRTYDYIVRLLGRSLFSIAGRMSRIFGLHKNSHISDFSTSRRKPTFRLSRSHSVAGVIPHSSDSDAHHLFDSGPLVPPRQESRSGPIETNRAGLPPPVRKRHSPRTKWPVAGSPFGGCMIGGNQPVVLQSCIPLEPGFRKSNAADGASPKANLKQVFETEPTSHLANAAAMTLGAAALSLHYANVIIVIEKLAASPNLIGPDARDDLYSMLTTSIKASLRARLKSYATNLASSVYDPVLAAEWSAAVARILEWLAPLAHNMIRWQSDRSFEQQQSAVSSSNVLLLQTLYFADQKKTEAAITELLVGLNYLWRYGRELDAKAMLECVGSGDLDDCLRMQVEVDAIAMPAMSDHQT
ncbi:uncharacterized protein LOC121981630 [Zingiber officinale]|nr:uncharacterized protein LOC121981630 [Zingiber officinale]